MFPVPPPGLGRGLAARPGANTGGAVGRRPGYAGSDASGSTFKGLGRGATANQPQTGPQWFRERLEKSRMIQKKKEQEQQQKQEAMMTSGVEKLRLA